MRQEPKSSTYRALQPKPQVALKNLIYYFVLLIVNEKANFMNFAQKFNQFKKITWGSTVVSYLISTLEYYSAKERIHIFIFDLLFQDYTCPGCRCGFIEELGHESSDESMSEEDSSLQQSNEVIHSLVLSLFF